MRVERDGEVALDVSMGPGGPLHPESAEAARHRPWFYTGSPFGQEILNLHTARYLGI